MVSKRNLMVMIIAVLCMVSLTGAQYSGFKYSEEEAALYKMPIKQITPKDGIETGHVIAYGHYIKPPYKVEVKIVDGDTGVYINNVKVEPPLYLPGFQPKRSKQTPAEYDSVMKQYQARFIELWQQYGVQRSIGIMDSLLSAYYESLNIDFKHIQRATVEVVILAIYWYYRSSYNIDESIAQLVNFLKDSLGIESQPASFAGAKGITFTRKDPVWGEMPSTIGIETPPERAESLRILNARYNRMDYYFKASAENYRSHLKKDGTLFLGWHLGRSAPGPMLFQKFLEVMTSDIDIDIEEKARRLRELRFSPKSVKQLIYNFDIKEYPNQGDEK